MGNVLADSVRHIPEFAAFDVLVKERFSDIQLDKILIDLVDNIPSELLEDVAYQFDVLGVKGFGLTTNDDERRDLIKKGIQLHRYKGTLYAVEESLRSIGFGDAVITEHVAGHWAKFSIKVNILGKTISATQIQQLKDMVAIWKNARSHLVDVNVEIAIDDSITVDADYRQNAEMTDGISVGGDFKYNGDFSYNGSKNYGSDSDIIFIQIV
jgi:P2-related tail formation protein